MAGTLTKTGFAPLPLARELAPGLARRLFRARVCTVMHVDMDMIDIFVPAHT